MDSFFFFSLSIYLFPSFFILPLLSHSRQTGIVWTSEGIRKELSEASSDELVCLYFIRKVRILGEKKEIRRKERFSFNLNLARAVALRSIGKKEFNMASRASCLNAKSRKISRLAIIIIGLKLLILVSRNSSRRLRRFFL